MTSSFRILLLGSALLAVTSAFAAQPPASKMVSKEIALEVLASSITLPTSAGISSAVFPACGGCPPKSFPTTAKTKYFINRQEVAVGDLKGAIVGQPNLILTAVYAAASGELISVTADLPGVRISTPAASRR